jgi:N-acetylglucosamine kinase-like BadF-type ATPase
MHLVGLDIGGSKTHALSRTPGRDDLELFAGSANLASVGPVESGRQLDVIFRALTESGRGPVEVVCAGAAGVDTPAGQATMRNLLSERAPDAMITVVHDAHLVLAAAGLDEGIALIAGTGSVAWGRDRSGQMARAGGWGYLLGDEGSGYAVAREAVRHALRLADRARTPDRLSRELTAACGVTGSAELRDHFYARPERRYWAGFAPIVCGLAADGDVAARLIIENAGEELADLVRGVCRTLGLPVPSPVVLAGGLLGHQPELRQAVGTALAPDRLTDLRTLDVDPVHGALALAGQAALVTGAERG